MWPYPWDQNVAYGDPRNTPISDAPGKLSASYLATGYLRVYGISVYNSNAAAQSILMFDAATLPADTAVPLMTFNVSATSALGVYYGAMGRIFKRGIVLCNSSTTTTKTIGAADCFFDVEYDYLPVPQDAPPDQGS